MDFFLTEFKIKTVWPPTVPSTTTKLQSEDFENNKRDRSSLDMGTYNGTTEDMQRFLHLDHRDSYARNCFIMGSSTTTCTVLVKSLSEAGGFRLVHSWQLG